MEFLQILPIMQLYGITTFSNNLSYNVLLVHDKILVRALAIIMPVAFLVMLIVYILSSIKKEIAKKEWFNNFIILLVYSFATCFVIVPIADETHFMIGSLCRNCSFYISYL